MFALERLEQGSPTGITNDKQALVAVVAQSPKVPPRRSRNTSRTPEADAERARRRWSKPPVQPVTPRRTEPLDRLDEADIAEDFQESDEDDIVTTPGGNRAQNGRRPQSEDVTALGIALQQLKHNFARTVKEKESMQSYCEEMEKTVDSREEMVGHLRSQNLLLSRRLGKSKDAQAQQLSALQAQDESEQDALNARRRRKMLPQLPTGSAHGRRMSASGNPEPPARTQKYKVSVLEQQIVDLTKQNRLLQDKVDESESTIQAHEKEHLQFELYKEEHPPDSDVKSVEEAIQAEMRLEEERIVTQRAVAALEEDKVRLQDELDEMHSLLEEVSADRAATAAAAAASEAASAAAIAAAGAAASAAAHEKLSLSAELEQMHGAAEADELQKRAEAAEAEMSTLAQANVGLETKLLAAEARAAAAEGKAAEQLKRAIAAEAKLSGLEHRASAAEGKLVQADARAAEAELKANEHHAALATAEAIAAANRQKAATQVAQLQAILSEDQADAEATLKAATAILQRKIAAAEDNTKRLQERLDATSDDQNATIGALEVENTNLKAEIETVKRTKFKGMTVSEQATIFDQVVEIKMELDEMQDELIMAKADAAKAMWEREHERLYTKSRNRILFGILSGPLSETDREQVVQMLLETEGNNDEGEAETNEGDAGNGSVDGVDGDAATVGDDDFVHVAPGGQKKATKIYEIAAPGGPARPDSTLGEGTAAANAGVEIKEEVGTPLIALHPYTADDEDELDMKKGEFITEVLGVDDDEGWITVVNASGKQGLVPESYVEPVAGVPGVYGVADMSTDPGHGQQLDANDALNVSLPVEGNL